MKLGFAGFVSRGSAGGKTSAGISRSRPDIAIAHEAEAAFRGSVTLFSAVHGSVAADERWTILRAGLRRFARIGVRREFVLADPVAAGIEASAGISRSRPEIAKSRRRTGEGIRFACLVSFQDAVPASSFGTSPTAEFFHLLHAGEAPLFGTAAGHGSADFRDTGRIAAGVQGSQLSADVVSAADALGGTSVTGAGIPVIALLDTFDDSVSTDGTDTAILGAAFAFFIGVAHAIAANAGLAGTAAEGHDLLGAEAVPGSGATIRISRADLRDAFVAAGLKGTPFQAAVMGTGSASSTIRGTGGAIFLSAAHAVAAETQISARCLANFTDFFNAGRIPKSFATIGIRRTYGFYTGIAGGLEAQPGLTALVIADRTLAAIRLASLTIFF